jgi:hypothetical protein
LNDLYDYDNSSFIQSLEDRGFYIATRSQSNYSQTALSLASSLNMEYLSGFSTAFSNRGQLIGMIRNSQTRLFLEHLGYKFVTFSTGYPLTNISNSDYYFSSTQIDNSNNLEVLLLMNSVGVIFFEQGWINLPISRYRSVQERINYTFTTLGEKVPLINTPKMVFAHIIAPHPPFIFDQNGSVFPEEFYFLQDGNTFRVSREDYIQNYVGQLIYINNRILQTIDGILANSQTAPIIIIQADHGPGAYLDQSSAENTCPEERFSILNAYYLPQAGASQLWDDISPVNTFPYIFNTYFGTHIKLLPNEEYYSTWERPFNFINVTENVKILCNLK